MSRAVWFVAGAAAGIYGTFRARRAVESLTVEGIKDRLGALEVGARMFAEEVAEGRIEKETQLRERFGLEPNGRLQLTSAEETGRALSRRGSH